MNETQKPFACTVEGCEMTFTNEDHLNWHHKKHDMVLNLGLANKNCEVADQTPTPTRFIRNCEEVGLFQDLQNVNPFDETFKKAIESAKSGTLHVSEAASNDDTLHTPHIFPHVEGNVKYVDARNDNQSTPSSDFCINNVASIQDNDESDENYDLTIVSDDSDKDNSAKRNSIDLKSKLKETIKNKSKTFAITPVPLERLQMNNGNEAQKRPHMCENNENSKRQKVDTYNIMDDDKAKIREMNRAAQLRCRKRKQVQWKKMEEDVKALKNENTKLLQENQSFKHKFYALKELLVKQKRNDSTENNNNALLSKIEDILNSPAIESAASRKAIPAKKQKSIKSKVSPIVQNYAIPIVQNVATQGVQKPVLIHVMGSVAQLALSVLPHK